MAIPFYKCNGNENKFIIILTTDLPLNYKFNKNKIKEICYKFDKEIVDGLILLNINNYKIDYYNNDGSWETFCLNGIRCCALLINKLKSNQNPMIICNNKKYVCHVLKNNNVKVRLKLPMYKKKNIIIEGYKGHYIDSGAKHFVIECDNNWPNDKNAYDIARTIRFNDEIFPYGINVNFYRILKKNIIEVKTYEKGIEAIMQSCASGSYACMYDYCMKYSISGDLTIKNKGGALYGYCTGNFKKVSLTGEAIIEYKRQAILNHK